jgi:hypothetical protein
VRRIFTFGCSLTSYEWPTWADALCLHYHLEEGCKTYNYGSVGMGNEHVVQALAAADLKHTFTDDDIICVLWSSWSREDRIWEDRGWGHHGNVLNSKVSVTFAKDHFSLENYIMKNITAIHSANKAYNINFQGNIQQVDDVGTVAEGDGLLHTFLTSMDQTNIAFTNADREAFCKANNDIDPMELIRFHDGHPSPAEHVSYLKSKVLPELGISSLNPKAELWMQDWTNRLLNLNLKLTGNADKEDASGIFWDTMGKWQKLRDSEMSSFQENYKDLWEARKMWSVESGVHSMLCRYLESTP